MAGPYYVDSSRPDDTGDGLSWATAKKTFAAGVAMLAADNEEIRVAHTHSESFNAAKIYTFAYHARVLCVNTGTNALTTGAVITTDTNYLRVDGEGKRVYWYGMTLAGPALQLAYSNDNHHIFESCALNISVAGGSSVYLAQTARGQVTLINCTFKFLASSHNLFVGGRTECIGGGISGSGGAVAPNCLISNGSTAPQARFIGFDFSFVSNTLFPAYVNTPGEYKLIGCRLHGSVSAVSTPIANNYSVHIYSCDSAPTNYRSERYTWWGSQIVKTSTLVRTGGASDGATSISWKIVSNANAEWVRPFVTTDIAVWNDAVGSPKTATVEILHDSATALNDDEVWLEIEYLGSASYPLATIANDTKANILATGTAQTASSVTWDTTGMTNPNKQKLEVTFTPQMAGYVTARVKVAKASKTLYVDPKLVIA